MHSDDRYFIAILQVLVLKDFFIEVVLVVRAIVQTSKFIDSFAQGLGRVYRGRTCSKSYLL